MNLEPIAENIKMSIKRMSYKESSIFKIKDTTTLFAFYHELYYGIFHTGSSHIETPNILINVAERLEQAACVTWILDRFYIECQQNYTDMESLLRKLVAVEYDTDMVYSLS
jgi:hypothetical protein